MPTNSPMFNDLDEIPRLPEDDNIIKYTIDAGCPINDPIKMPVYEGDTGYDLGCALQTLEMVLGPGKFYDIPTYVRIELPPGWWGDIRPRSSTYAKRKLVVMHGTIDNKYRGMLSVFVYNPNDYDVTIHQGDYLAQLVLLPINTPPLIKATKLSPTQRGTKGFGSSGGMK